MSLFATSQGHNGFNCNRRCNKNSLLFHILIAGNKDVEGRKEMKVIDSNVWGCSSSASITSAYNAAPTNSQIVYIICGLVGARLHMLVFEHVRVTNFNALGMC